MSAEHFDEVHDRPSATQQLTLCWNAFTKRHTIVGTITILAEADAFDAFANEMVVLHREGPFTSDPAPAFAMFKTARIYKLAHTGFKVRFLAELAQDFTLEV